MSGQTQAQAERQCSQRTQCQNREDTFHTRLFAIAVPCFGNEKTAISRVTNRHHAHYSCRCLREKQRQLRQRMRCSAHIPLALRCERPSLVVVSKLIFIVLALALAIHPLALNCEVPQAGIAVGTPCGSANCPLSSGGARTCCQVQHPSALAEAVSGKPEVPSFQALGVLIQAHSFTPVSDAFGRVAVLPDTPLQAPSLALLCSRQI